MSFKTEANDCSCISGNIGAKIAYFFKTHLLFALVLPFLMATQAVKAESPPIETLNAGINDAWFSPATAGQGFFITVYPDLGVVALAWFTYDTELPLPEAEANLGNPGHRWLTASGPFVGNTANLTVFVSRGGEFDAANPVPVTDPVGDGTIVLEFADCTQGLVKYEITSLGISGEIPIQRVASDNTALCETLAAPDPIECTRPEPDDSHGENDPVVINTGIVPQSDLIEGGPGPDGIPALTVPLFIQDANLSSLDPSELVVGVRIGNQIRAYPHNILNWHEVVNDSFRLEDTPQNLRATLSYCPLTGSAMLWEALTTRGDITFGTSGLLYNSNLVMYDRATNSLWSQMMEQSIRGSRVTWIPDRLPVLETTWGVWKDMYPETWILSENTGWSRNYSLYPYGSYRTNLSLLFPVNNIDDTRLHPKERVLGINVGDASKVYTIASFPANVGVTNETVGDMRVVVAGSSGSNFAMVFNRELEDCTLLEFEAVQDKLPVVMRDNEGNEWDVFGVAVSGARTGQQLQKTNSYVAYWFSWTAFFPGASIRQ